MTDLTELQAALSDDTTPTGIDLPAVRARARRTRRRTLLATSAATLAVVAAVAVPTALAGRGRHQQVPAAAAADVTLRCPRSPFDHRDSRPLVPFPARQLLICEYGAGPPRSTLAGATVQQTGAVVAAVARQLQDTAREMTGRPCTLQLESPVVLEFGAADGRTATVTTQRSGCGLVPDPALQKMRQAPGATGCPATQPAPSGGSADEMLPAGTDGLLVCGYSGSSLDSSTPLVAAAVLAGRPAAALVEQANALPATQGEPSCPSTESLRQAVIVGLGPEAGARVNVDLHCPVVTNGTRKALLSPDLEDTLSALVG